jgi:hypothetical protein
LPPMSVDESTDGIGDACDDKGKRKLFFGKFEGIRRWRLCAGRLFTCLRWRWGHVAGLSSKRRWWTRCLWQCPLYVRLAPQADTALFIQLAPSSHHHFTGRGLVIMLRGFQIAHLAARPERRNNHSQHFIRWGPGRRVEPCDAFNTEIWRRAAPGRWLVRYTQLSCERHNCSRELLLTYSWKSPRQFDNRARREGHRRRVSHRQNHQWRGSARR